MTRIRKAVIPAAGLGTRLLPATKAIPKEMLPILYKPAIQLVVEEAALSGIESILIVTGRNKYAIEDHFDKSYELEAVLRNRQKTEVLNEVTKVSQIADIQYIRQGEPIGLGHAILSARNFVGHEAFAILLPDDIFYAETPALSQLLSFYEQVGSPVVGVQKVSWSEITKYGIVTAKEQPQPLREECFPVSKMVEKPNVGEIQSNCAMIGRYILTHDIFPVLNHIGPGRNGEYQLTDGLTELSRQTDIYACTVHGQRYDIGTKLGYFMANIDYALTQPDICVEVRKYLRQVVENL